jgi:hypothetical protein
MVDRERKVLELRRTGMSYADIATAVGYTGPGAAWKACQRALTKTLQEPADEVRTIELVRLDSYLTYLQDKIERGDVRAIETALRVMDRRAKYLGIDAPTKAQIEVTTYDGDSVDAEIQRLVELLGEASGGSTNTLDDATSEAGTVTN